MSGWGSSGRRFKSSRRDHITAGHQRAFGGAPAGTPTGHCQVVDLVWWLSGLVVVAIAARHKDYRYPIEVIGHAVWLYHRFTLSLRDVEELMLARGVVVTHETIRSWCAKLGPDYAAQ